MIFRNAHASGISDDKNQQNILPKQLKKYKLSTSGKECKTYKYGKTPVPRKSGHKNSDNTCIPNM